MNKDILEKLFAILKAFNISYVLIGGYAAAVWGSVRATKDVDFLADVPYLMIDKVVEALEKQGFSVEYRSGDIGDPVRGVIELEFQIEEDKESVELIQGIKNMPGDIFSRSEKIGMLGIEIPVASPEDLIVLKLLAGGPVDKQDARTIYKIMRDKLDMQYLEKELRRCKLSLESLFLES